jgi:osmoprotectant transport system ATP-binding protein
MPRVAESGVGVELRGVTFAERGAAPRVDSVDLSVAPGETLVLLGRSGCGKTTTLRLVNALLLPTAGEVRVGGRATTAWDAVELRRSIGYVIQESGLFPHWNVETNVGIVPRLRGWPAERVASRVREMLALVNLEPDRFARRFPDELSGGERQRVGIARAFAGDPPLVLLDEPFGALDPPTREDVRREFRDLARRFGKTMLFVTHDLREALLLADRVALLERGRLAFLGTPRDLVSSDAPEARAFAATLATGALG